MQLRRHLRSIAVLGAIIALGLATAPSADATVSIDFAGGLATATSAPSGPVPPGTAFAAIAAGPYAVGGTTVQVNGLSASQLYNVVDQAAQADTVTIALQNLTSTAVDIIVIVTSDNYVAPTGIATATDSFGTSNVSTGSSVDFSANVTNIGDLDTLTLVGAGLGTVAPPPTSETGSLTNPFTITQTIVIHLGGNAVASFSATTQVSAVPEPTTTVMVASACRP